MLLNRPQSLCVAMSDIHVLATSETACIYNYHEGSAHSQTVNTTIYYKNTLFLYKTVTCFNP
jgi:hypothetical protein